MREPGGRERANRDRNGEDAEISGDDLLGRAQHGLHQRRHQRQCNRADQPEPAGDEAAPPQAVVAPQILEQRSGRARDVRFDAKVRCGLPGARDEQARGPAQDGEHHDHGAEHRRMAAFGRGKPAHDGAEQDRHEGRAFDQRVAGGQFLLLQVIRQNAVLDRTKQRGADAEQEQGREHDGQRMQPEADDADARHADLGELHPARHHRLVEAVGHLSAEAGQEEERRDEHRSRERDQRSAVFHAGCEQD